MSQLSHFYINHRFFQAFRFNCQTDRFVSTTFSLDNHQKQTVESRTGRFRKGYQASRITIIRCHNLSIADQATRDDILSSRYITPFFIDQRYRHKHQIFAIRFNPVFVRYSLQANCLTCSPDISFRPFPILFIGNRFQLPRFILHAIPTETVFIRSLFLLSLRFAVQIQFNDIA